MTLRAADAVGVAGVTPVSFTPTVSDTVSGNDIIPGGGAAIRVATSGTVTNVSVLDPNLTAQGNPGTVTAVATLATGTKYVLLPISSVNPSTGVATVTFSTTTGVTCEVIRF